MTSLLTVTVLPAQMVFVFVHKTRFGGQSVQVQIMKKVWFIEICFGFVVSIRFLNFVGVEIMKM